MVSVRFGSFDLAHPHALCPTPTTKNWLIVIVASLHSSHSKREEEEEEIDIMNIQMGGSLPTKKLNRNNFPSWEYKMHQYLVGQGYWSYIVGAHEDRPIETTSGNATGS